MAGDIIAILFNFDNLPEPFDHHFKADPELKNFLYHIQAKGPESIALVQRASEKEDLRSLCSMIHLMATGGKRYYTTAYNVSRFLDLLSLAETHDSNYTEVLEIATQQRMQEEATSATITQQERHKRRAKEFMHEIKVLGYSDPALRAALDQLFPNDRLTKMVRWFLFYDVNDNTKAAFDAFITYVKSWYAPRLPYECPKIFSAEIRDALSGRGNSKWVEEEPCGNTVIGAISEMLVMADLLSRHIHVYRTQTHQAPCDLVAVGAEWVLTIEVRTGKANESGIISYSKDTRGNVDVFAVSTGKGIFYFPELDVAIEAAKKRREGYHQ